MDVFKCPQENSKTNHRIMASQTWLWNSENWNPANAKPILGPKGPYKCIIHYSKDRRIIYKHHVVAYKR